MKKFIFLYLIVFTFTSCHNSNNSAKDFNDSLKAITDKGIREFNEEKIKADQKLNAAKLENDYAEHRISKSVFEDSLVKRHLNKKIDDQSYNSLCDKYGLMVGLH